MISKYKYVAMTTVFAGHVTSVAMTTVLLVT